MFRILNIRNYFELIPAGMLRPDFACLRRSVFAQAGASASDSGSAPQGLLPRREGLWLGEI